MNNTDLGGICHNQQRDYFIQDVGEVHVKV